jgi:hypothetical protein
VKSSNISHAFDDQTGRGGGSGRRPARYNISLCRTHLLFGLCHPFKPTSTGSIKRSLEKAAVHGSNVDSWGAAERENAKRDEKMESGEKGSEHGSKQVCVWMLSAMVFLSHNLPLEPRTQLGPDSGALNGTLPGPGGLMISNF